MFGYVIPNAETLPKERQDRFRAIYCGLCHTLHHGYGRAAQLTTSYDMTFLALVLQALYEPDECSKTEACAPHPIKKHAYVESEMIEYAADMNVLLAYQKAMDNWLDDHSVSGRTEAGLLKSTYKKLSDRYPRQCGAIEKWLGVIHDLEKSDSDAIDLFINATGTMLGELFVYRQDDHWSEDLRKMGESLGRFIYFMDAYDDLPEDIKHNRFNPLKRDSTREGYETRCKDALMLMIADCAEAFERLPIVQDADIIRNILYSGVWSKYAMIQKKRQEAQN